MRQRVGRVGMAAGRGRDVADALARRLVAVEPASGRRRAGAARPVRWIPRGRADLRVDRRRPARAGRRATSPPRCAAARASSPGRARPTCCRRSCTATRPDHPLANREFLFPFASVVDVADGPTSRRPRPDAGPDRDDGRRRADAAAGRFAAHPAPEPRPDSDPRVSWDQPHEGNLFEHLSGRAAPYSPWPRWDEAAGHHRRARGPCTAGAACATTRWPRSSRPAGTTSRSLPSTPPRGPTSAT